MAQHDFNIANATFPSVRSDINSVLEAINTSNSGTSRPSSAVAGTIWLDTTSATTPTLKFYDGADDISLATLDYTANTVNWLDSTVTFSQLGQDLDVNGNSIVSVSNGNITFTPDGTGKVVISGLSFPTSDGTADQVLKTDGSGNLSFTDVSGGTSWQSSIVTATTLTAVAGNGYWINTTSNACTITLPASASVGDTIEFSDYARKWGTNAVTINPNSLNFQGNTSPNPVYNTNGQSVRLVYSGATQGWIPTVDDDVTLETPQPYSADMLIVAGGGAGGSTGASGGGGGGAGAGGFRTSTQTLSGGATYTVTVGGGGSVGTASDGTDGQGGNGGNSSISGSGITTITSTGGGGGGAAGANNGAGQAGKSGGSGGGTGAYGTNVGGSGNTPSTSPSQGNNGGHMSGNFYNGGGGGGGANAVGGNVTTNLNAGAGGNGTASSITGSSVTYGGGGGGGVTASNPTTPIAGGTGGGGFGGIQSGAGAADGSANTGGGGGGSYQNSAGAGGSGVVILSVPTANYSGTTTGSPTVTTSGSDTIIKFTGSGSYTA